MVLPGTSQNTMWISLFMGTSNSFLARKFVNSTIMRLSNLSNNVEIDFLVPFILIILFLNFHHPYAGLKRFEMLSLHEPIYNSASSLYLCISLSSIWDILHLLLDVGCRIDANRHLCQHLQSLHAKLFLPASNRFLSQWSTGFQFRVLKHQWREHRRRMHHSELSQQYFPVLGNNFYVITPSSALCCKSIFFYCCSFSNSFLKAVKIAFFIVNYICINNNICINFEFDTSNSSSYFFLDLLFYLIQI